MGIPEKILLAGAGWVQMKRNGAMKNKGVVIGVTCLILVFICVLKFKNSTPPYLRKCQDLREVRSENVELKNLIVKLDELPYGWQQGVNFVRTKHNHGEEIVTANYNPPTGLNGFYQEVIRYDNGFDACSFFMRLDLMPSHYWIRDSQYKIEAINHAGQWALGCREEIYQGQDSCGLLARYKNIIVYIGVTSEKHMTTNEFRKIVENLDSRACIMDLCE